MQRLSADWLRQKYWDEGLSTAQIGLLIQMPRETLRRRMIQYKIPRRQNMIGGKGKESPYWKGGRRITVDGYVLKHRDCFALVEQSLLAPMFDKANLIREHRAVLALALHRSLKKGDVVHHKNGDRADNRLANLRLVTHHKESICPRCGWPTQFYDDVS